MNTNTAEQTKPTHTPEPWKRHPSHRYSIVDGNNRHLADAYALSDAALSSTENAERREANAALIAQAPTLLAQRDALAAELSGAIRQRDALAHELSEAAEYIWTRPRYGYTAEASQKLESMVKRWRSTAAIAKHL